MRVTLMGAADVSFTDSNGKQVRGTSLYTAFSNPKVQGQCTERFFVNDDILLPDDAEIGCELELSFNYKGKIESITKV